jgi:hypothetical protein
MLGKCIFLFNCKTELRSPWYIGSIFQAIIWNNVIGGADRRGGLVAVMNLNTNTQYRLLTKLLQCCVSTASVSVESCGNVS